MICKNKIRFFLLSFFLSLNCLPLFSADYFDLVMNGDQTIERTDGSKSFQLFAAAESKDWDAIRALLDVPNISVNIVRDTWSVDGATPLDVLLGAYSDEAGFQEIIAQVCERGAITKEKILPDNFKSKYDGKMSLLFLEMARDNNTASMRKILDEHLDVVDVNTCYQDFEYGGCLSPLDYVLYFKNVEIARRLLSLGARLSFYDTQKFKDRCNDKPLSDQAVPDLSACKTIDKKVSEKLYKLAVQGDFTRMRALLFDGANFAVNVMEKRPLFSTLDHALISYEKTANKDEAIDVIRYLFKCGAIAFQHERCNYEEFSDCQFRFDARKSFEFHEKCLGYRFDDAISIYEQNPSQIDINMFCVTSSGNTVADFAVCTRDPVSFGKIFNLGARVSNYKIEELLGRLLDAGDHELGTDCNVKPFLLFIFFINNSDGVLASLPNELLSVIKKAALNLRVKTNIVRQKSWAPLR